MPSKLGASKPAPSLIPPPPNSTRANCKSVSLNSAAVSLSSKQVVPPKSKSVPNYDHMPSIGRCYTPIVVTEPPSLSIRNSFLSSSSPYALRPAYGVHATQPISSNHFITPYLSRITPSASYLANSLNSHTHLRMPKPFVHLIRLLHWMRGRSGTKASYVSGKGKRRWGLICSR